MGLISRLVYLFPAKRPCSAVERVVYFTLNPRKRNELVTTKMLLNAIALAASIGINAPIVRGSASTKSLSLSGVLNIGSGAYLTVGTTCTNQGNATIDSQGTIGGNGEVTPSGTFHFLSSGTIIGNLTIDPLATASVGVVYMQGNVLKNGTLTGEDQDAQFHMQSLLFTNYGAV